MSSRAASLVLVASCTAYVGLHAAPAAAQASRTWVSGHGDDANACTRIAPCRTYAGAITRTSVDGVIDCLDPGAFGALNITKSVSVVCELGSVGAVGAYGFRIDAPAGSIVTLRGQDIDCGGVGVNGIEIANEGVTVHVQKTSIRNCRGGSGIAIVPSSGIAKIDVVDSVITNNGAALTEAGILVRPTNAAAVNLGVHNVQLADNTNGIYADGSGGGGNSRVGVTASVLSGSTNNGIAISSASASFSAVVTNSALQYNTNAGAAAAGASGSIRLGGNTITQNGTGVANTGGTLESFKDNYIVANGSDGTPITAVVSGGLIKN